MPHTADVLSYADAALLVQQEAAGLPWPAETETLPLLEADGRVLAAPLVADRDQPPFARSTRDGFAGRAEEWNRGPLQVNGSLRAGETPSADPLPPGCCLEIMTGAPVPAGADCVAMVEHVERSGNTVRLTGERRLKPDTNLVPQAAEARAGDVLLLRGTRLRAQDIAVAAACGHAQVCVYRRPRVAILATGDELVGLEQTPERHQIRNSNSYGLAAQVRASGAEPLLGLAVPDDARALEAAIERAAAQCDLLLLSGGVSMGRYDLVEPALVARGGRFHFTGIRIQPGKPLVFGAMDEGKLPFFGLPGNPVSTMVCFALFVAPLLAALGGELGYQLPLAQARLMTAQRNEAPLTRFLPARLRTSGLSTEVEPVLWQGSGDLAAAARANCFLILPEGAKIDAGETAAVLLA